ncbi:MAG: transposase [Candidatus Latescibacteria bacterium]|nr:transposase [Candidatus Latescibacterota bacterium]
MKFNREIHRHRSIRLKGYDYSQAGAYFVTVCIEDRECLFGDIVEGEMLANDAGRMVEMVWNQIPDHFPGVAIDGFQIMPNHIHGIVVIVTDGRGTAYCRGTACRAPTASVEQFGKPVSGSLSTIVRSFKSAVTKRINETRNAHDAKLWQRNYYEHIIRDENELNRIREYIVNNPMNWESDCENPVGTAPRVCPDNKTVRESPHQYGKETWMI